MRTAVIFEKRIARGDVVKAAATGYTDYPRYQWLAAANSKNACTQCTFFLTAGTYTVSAEAEYSDIGVRVCTYKDRTAAGIFPASGWEALPYTFTLTEAREVSVDLYRESGLSAANVTEIRVHDVQNPSGGDVYKRIVMPPDEIADVCTIKQEINAITNITLRIYPHMEAWRFCERTLTYVRVFDLDKTENRMIFKGRVTAVNDRMERGGKMYQDVVCASALDFLKDTPADGYKVEHITPWLLDFFDKHDDQMDDGDYRKLIYSTAEMQSDYRVTEPQIYGSRYDTFMKVLTSGEQLQKYVGGIQDGVFKLEIRERYSNDISCIDIAESFGERKSTPIKLGENLAELAIERSTDGGIYTAVQAVSGENSDGSRYRYTRSNEEMAVQYGTGRTKVIVCESIRCTAAMYEWVDHETYAREEETEANRAMQAALQAYAVQEAANLSAPPARITLTAHDLAQAGMTGYEPFEVYNSYPIVHPDFSLHGQYARVYAVTRRLSDGKIQSMTVGTGDDVPSQSRSMSALMARLEEANRAKVEDNQSQQELVDAKIEEQTGGTKIKPYTKNLFEKMPLKDTSTLYVVDDGTDVELWYGDRHINTGGGEGQTIECAAVLTSEQMTEWAPQHELVPVEFRGTATVYYGQPPARFVVQGYRAVYASSPYFAGYTADDIVSEAVLDLPGGYREKYKVSLREIRYNSLVLALSAYDVSGAAETYIGSVTQYVYPPTSFSSRKIGLILYCSGWAEDTDTGRLCPSLSFGAAAAQDGTVYMGSLFERISRSNFSNPVPVTEAESGLGTALSLKTEPTGGETEGGEG